MSDTLGSFASFRDGLSGKMTQLRRRFSQGEMQGDDEESDQQPGSLSNPSANPPYSALPTAAGQNQNTMYGPPSMNPSQKDRPRDMSLNLNTTSPSVSPGSASGSTSAVPAATSSSMQQQQQQPMQYQQQQRPLPKTTSAPSSPTKNYTPANIARSIFRQVSQSTTNLVQQTVAAAGGAGASGPREKCKILLVIDDQHTDWSKYFRGRRIQNEWEIRIEQAEFNEINMAATSDRGLAVDMEVMRGGTKVIRSFRPDFILIRQPIRDASRDYRHLLLALMYANIPAVNSLESLYTFLDKPLIFGQLIQIQQRLGRDRFPLIQQCFYPNHREMLTSTSFPVVIKIGHAHGGLGKTRVETHYDFQDIVSLVGSCGAYCSVEPFIDSKYDLHLQKIGPSYKAFVRKSISGTWKANIGSSMLEQVPLQDKHRMWLDECSRLSGGLDVFAIEVITGKDGQEHIIGVNDSSSMSLLGETQEEDRQMIAEIVFRKMDSDANRRRSSAAPLGAVGVSEQRPLPPGYGTPPQIPATQGVANGYPGAPARRESREVISQPGPGSRDQVTSSPNRRDMGPGAGGMSATSGSMARDASRDPPLRDPRDSNIRDVGGPRESANTARDTPGRDNSGPGGPGNRRDSENRSSMSNPNVAPPGSAGSGFNQAPVIGSSSGPGIPSDRRQMSQTSMGATGVLGNGPGINRPGAAPQLAPQPQPNQSSGGQVRPPNSGDTDDTMSNLKRTFAGIFGDM